MNSSSNKIYRWQMCDWLSLVCVLRKNIPVLASHCGRYHWDLLMEFSSLLSMISLLLKNRPHLGVNLFLFLSSFGSENQWVTPSILLSKARVIRHRRKIQDIMWQKGVVKRNLGGGDRQVVPLSPDKKLLSGERYLLDSSKKGQGILFLINH